MKCLLAIIFGIAMYGTPVASIVASTVASTVCYECSFVNCTDADFDLTSFFVDVVPCAGGQCYIKDTGTSNIFSSLERGCGLGVCDQQVIADDTTCCDGDVCNGPVGGIAVGDGGGAPVAPLVCYECSYFKGPDFADLESIFVNCTDADFDLDSIFVNGVPCTGGQCYITETRTSFLRTFERGCGLGVCDQQVIPDGTTCCDGDVCNGPVGGVTNGDTGGDAGGDAGGATGDGNQCYSCIDVAGNGCDNDNFDVDQAETVTCPGKCMKTWASRDDEATVSIRGCVPTDEYGMEMECKENGCDSHVILGVRIESCQFCCQGELCNGAGSAAISMAVIFSVTAVSALIVMIF